MKKIVILACLLFPSLAMAQYYSAPPPNSRLPGGFHNRSNSLIFGFSLGLGGMSENGEDIECANCEYSSLSGQGSIHLGGFIAPRFALMGELQANVQTLEAGGFEGDATLVQSALMLAGQFWLTPQLWIKGGIGFANLQVQDDYFGDSRPENGGAIMGAVGFEVFSTRRFAVDIQGRILNASYDSLDSNVTSYSVGVGFNWF